MIELNQKQLKLIEASLLVIRQEMDRLYWNKYQKEMSSPFDNTGNEYFNDVFSVKAYSWDDYNWTDEPNFRYKGLSVAWYKYLGRAMSGTLDTDKDLGVFLEDMIEDCFNSMRKDFEENNE